MKNLREILESKTKEELAYLYALASYQFNKKQGLKADESNINHEAEYLLIIDKNFGGVFGERMINALLKEVSAENLRPEQI